MIPEFVYCYILRPWPLRDITNWIIKKLLPIKVKIGKYFFDFTRKLNLFSGGKFLKGPFGSWKAPLCLVAPCGAFVSEKQTFLKSRDMLTLQKLHFLSYLVRILPKFDQNIILNMPDMCSRGTRDHLRPKKFILRSNLQHIWKKGPICCRVAKVTCRKYLK